MILTCQLSAQNNNKKTGEIKFSFAANLTRFGFFLKCCSIGLGEKRPKQEFVHLSPVQSVMIVDDGFNYHARLNTNYRALS